MEVGTIFEQHSVWASHVATTIRNHLPHETCRGGTVLSETPARHMQINSTHAALRWDHLHSCFASCTTFQGTWNMLHTCQSLCSQQIDGWVLFVTQEHLYRNVIWWLRNASVAVGAEDLLHLPRHRHNHWHLWQPTALQDPYSCSPSAQASELQASPESSTAIARSVLPAEKLLTHQTTQS